MAGDTREQIMDATFAALCERGFADLTMQSIADEFEKSKSLLHYHFDSKEDLLVSFLEHLLEEFIADIEDCPEMDPAGRLLWMAQLVITGHGDDWAEDFHTAMLELRAQAPYNDAIREQLVHNDAVIREEIAGIVREGIAAGQFREVDPEVFAATFRSAIEGAQSHEVILGEAAPTDDALAGVEDLLVSDLLAEGVELED
ncbi:TetR/AcrR family transcriptional regulator [Halomicrobium salinisoli]|uniref:TetR/AcrR family transcriptional regulator n=1 Tax=Halomicrobium salinisoli TaxID=2878391 RepID=UPI001CF0C9A7|nr:TetR/AcrR family transcriptional regulator [Halomicrobium salinisoli]